MKKGLIKAGCLILIFFVALLVCSKILNGRDTGLTAAMSPATLPVIRTEIEGQQMNLIRGVEEGMEIQTLRDSVSPLNADRTLKIIINLGETKLKGISYEVRSLDALDFLESNEVKEYEQKGDALEATLHLKNLLEEDWEYLLKITLELGNGKKYDYLTRVILNEELHTKEKLDFVQDFHNKTFHKDEAHSLIKNLESNSSGDNSRFQKVNIHSSFDQVTFGDLNIAPVGQEEYFLKDQDSEVGVFLVDYLARSENTDGSVSLYKVEEYYRVRYTSQRMYLLDFERTMEEYFQPQQKPFGKDNIALGIADADMEFSCSEDGKQIAFVTGGELWCYTPEEDKLFSVFSFLNQDYSNVRTNGSQHDIKILSIEENGDMDFLVYGYMSRGVHEGQTGIGVYRFSYSRNCVEEIGFVPSRDGFQLLKEEVGQFAYINKKEELFIMLGGMVYNINTKNKSWEVVAEGLQEESFAISAKGDRMAWQTGSNLYDAAQITIMNLDTGKKTILQAEENERILPIGFMKEDFIYGVARVGEIDLNRTYVPFPMYKLCILDSNQNLDREYAPAGLYIRTAKVEGNVINLERVKIGESGFEDAAADHMVNNEIEEVQAVFLKTIITEEKKTQLQLKLRNEITDTTPKLLNPKQVVYEGSREIALEQRTVGIRYYVFAKGKLDCFYSNASEAIEKANDCAGTVLDNRLNYVWERGHRKTKVKLAEIGPANFAAGNNSIEICANTLLRMEGKGQTALTGLQLGAGMVAALETELENAGVYNLTGCTLSQVLYYVNRGYPVMAMMSGDTMCLIVGYDKLNTIIMEPVRNETYYVGMNDSTKMFEEAGNVFYAYLPGQGLQSGEE